MFTGLVQAVGTVREVAADGHGGRSLRIAEPTYAGKLVVGESVAVNGACLTVVEDSPAGMLFQAGPETLARTTLGTLAAGDPVNLERALRMGDPLGGHLVSGHIDCVGTVAERTLAGDWETVWFEFPASYDELLVVKGSVAVDGVSLTVADVQPGRLSVMLIPHTRAVTTLGQRPVGAAVNLEFDLIAKHVQKLFSKLTINL